MTYLRFDGVAPPPRYNTMNQQHSGSERHDSATTTHESNEDLNRTELELTARSISAFRVTYTAQSTMSLRVQTVEMERVTLEDSPDGRDGHSSASDEDANPVEVRQTPHHVQVHVHT